MIALGCDHGGYELKQEIIKYLEENNLPFKDFGCYDNSSVDYPIYRCGEIFHYQLYAG